MRKGPLFFVSAKKKAFLYHMFFSSSSLSGGFFLLLFALRFRACKRRRAKRRARQTTIKGLFAERNSEWPKTNTHTGGKTRALFWSESSKISSQSK